MAETAQNWSTLAEKKSVEAVPLAERWPAETVYAMLRQTAAAHPRRPAISFQIKSGPTDKAETLNWTQLTNMVTRAANLFRRIGIGEGDVVAYLLPNCNEVVLALLGGATAGIVNPVNPLLDVDQIAALLRESGAKALVTLAPFPKTDIAQKAHAAVAMAPSIETVLEVDLKRYLSPPLSWLIPLIRPKVSYGHSARVLDFNAALMAENGAELSFKEEDGDRVAAYFHTGGTTGMPKIAQHRQQGMVYNGLIPAMSVATEMDVLICPLPLFHVLAAYPVLMACVASGAHFVMPTPAGYRGDGVMDNFWALVERWGVSFMVMVPTAASALMQRPVKSDVSSLKYALCGSAPLPVELFKRFEKATGVKILEGYGMTEATCLVSFNPLQGERKIGSVGLPVPYTDVKILDCETDGTIRRECAPDQIGEICIAGPAVFPGYTDEARNKGLWAVRRAGALPALGRSRPDRWRRLSLDHRPCQGPDHPGRPQHRPGHDRGGDGGPPGGCLCRRHRPAGRPFRRAALRLCGTGGWRMEKVPEHAAVPKYIEVMDELPKTAVGKIFKPALRKMAITRIYSAALAEAGIKADIKVVEDKTRGLVARVTPRDGAAEADIGAALGQFTPPWEMAL
jgi:acyl-CoA synthetase (AMP-forming)/AMP-acid ligase II